MQLQQEKQNSKQFCKLEKNKRQIRAICIGKLNVFSVRALAEKLPRLDNSFLRALQQIQSDGCIPRGYFFLLYLDEHRSCMRYMWGIRAKLFSSFRIRSLKKLQNPRTTMEYIRKEKSKLGEALLFAEYVPASREGHLYILWCV